MNVEEALYARLAADAGVVHLASTRIYPLVIPQDADLPALAYQRITYSPVREHAGVSDWAAGRFQLTCTAATYAAAVGLATAVRRCLDGFRGVLAGGVTVAECSVEGQVDGYNEIADTATVRVDVEMLYRE